MKRWIRLLVAVLLVVAVLGGVGAAGADEGQENEKAPCPHDNPNQGGENAVETGLTKSQPGIQRAASRIC